MSRKNVRVDIPINNPDEMVKLAKAVYKYHYNPGPEGSPLSNSNVDALDNKRAISETKRLEGKELHSQAEAATEAADLALGAAEGQSVLTNGTMYNLLTGMRDQLLVTYRGREEELEKYGFNVVISTSIPHRNSDGEAA